MLSGLGAPELIIVLVVLLLVFGSKRLPDSARSLGRSLRIFKAETKGLREDDAAAKPIGTEQPRFDPYTGEPLKPPAGTDTPS